MSRAKPIAIGDINFERQGDALTFFKSMLARYPVGSDVGAEDEVYLRALLLPHIHYDEKVGSGLLRKRGQVHFPAPMLACRAAGPPRCDR